MTDAPTGNLGRFVLEALERMDSEKRTLVVRPEDREWAWGIHRLFPNVKVQVSTLPPEGKVYLIDESAIE